MTVEGDVVDNYLVWELCKQKSIQRKIIQKSPDKEKLRKEVEKVRKRYQEKEYSLEEKFDLVRDVCSNPDYRLKNFRNCSWRKETVKIGDLGTTIPRAGDLPPEVITGSLPEVLDFVRGADPEKYQSVKYITKLKEFPEVLEEFLPSVISPGNAVRKLHKMNREHGEKQWNIDETYGAIEDGNHRTIARILANNLEEIKCYIGHPKKNY